MTLATFINRYLAAVDLPVMRRSTHDRVLSELDRYQAGGATVEDVSVQLAELAGTVGDLAGQPRGPGGTYLNFGSGAWSSSVARLRNEGWDVLGFEPHGSAARGADHLIGSREELSTLRFDGIFSNNVLEHLREPADELAMLGRLLEPGGRMAHATPCFEYRYEFTRFHLYFYLGRSAEVLAEQAGLVVKDFEVDGELMCSIMEPA